MRLNLKPAAERCDCPAQFAKKPIILIELNGIHGLLVGQWK